MKELRLTLRLRNNRLLSEREKRGLNQDEMAAAAGICKANYAWLETLRIPARMASGAPRPTASTLAAFLGIAFDDLFPAWVDLVRQPVVDRELDAEDVAPLLAASLDAAEPPSLPDAAVAHRELRSVLDGLLGTLTVHEAFVLRRRFGLDDDDDKTCAETGIGAGVHGENISRQGVLMVLARALRKLRQPSRSKNLRAFLEDT